MSLARNKGLKEANGDYISFVDSDDYIEPDYVEKMLLTLKSKKVDIVSYLVKPGDVISLRENTGLFLNIILFTLP